MANKLKLINKFEKIIDSISSLQNEMKNEVFTDEELSYILQISNDLLHNSKLVNFISSEISIDYKKLNDIWANFIYEYENDIRKKEIKYSNVKKIIKDKIFTK
jgi:hypothetical protein